MKKQLSLALLFVLICWGHSAYAVTYYWVLSGTSNGIHYASASSACQAGNTELHPDSITTVMYTFASLRSNNNGGASFKCLYSVKTTYSSNGQAYEGDPSDYLDKSAVRMGDSCPAGGLFDPNTGECDIPPCPVGQIRDTMTGLCITAPSECKSKMGKSHSIWLHTFDFEMCISGCSLAITSAQPVKRLVDEGVDYDVEGVFTGDVCEGNTPIDETCGDNCEISPPSESSTDTECTATVTDGEGRQQSNCQTTDIMKDNQACVARGGALGAYQGMQTCVEANKGPKATQTTKDVKQTTEATPDGGMKTTTETTTTTKNCIGIKSCTTTSTTVTTVSNTNSNGTKGSESSSCKGANCGTGGKPSETPGESEEQEEEGIPGPTKSLVKTDSPGFGETGKEWEDKIAAGRQQLDGLIDKYSNLFSGAFDLNIGTGGGALPCYQIPIASRFINTTLDFCPAKYEDQLVYLKYILLACAAILAGFFVLRD